MDEIDKALSDLLQSRQDQKKLKIDDIKDIKKRFKKTCDETKLGMEKLEAQQKKNKPNTRSHSRRPETPKRAVYSDGKWINKGIDDAEDIYSEEEKEKLRKAITRLRKITSLKSEHIKYLVIDVLLNELKDIKSGKLESEFHDRYINHGGQSKKDLQAEIRTSLFTNEQRDYISGLLQGAFGTTTKDINDDIKHSEINYVLVVMLYECIARIVQHVHKFSTIQEALKHIRKSSREASGIEDDDDDNDDDVKMIDLTSN